MYEIIKSVIEALRYDLNDMLKKIDTIWIQGDITDEQKTELVELARNKANPENSYAPLQKQVEELYKMLNELKATVETNSRGMAAIKEEVEKLSGSSIVVPDPEPAEEYPEFIQPAGAHDAYNIGDKVTFEGDRYECLINGCVWSPVAYPQGWKKIQ